MAQYTPPINDMLFTITEVANLSATLEQTKFAHIESEIVVPVLEEAGKLAKDILAPLNSVGDTIGAQRQEDGQVVSPEGFAAAYQTFAEGGWCGLGVQESHGGQGLPMTIVGSVTEMLNGANLAFALCPLLTQGVLDALEVAGSEAQKKLFMPPLIEGRWSGTMNLTEPQAGTDLSSIKTMAHPHETGETWGLKGQKIYITWGEHDMTDNIVHLVLARTPNAPEGIKGISLFIVPKFLPDENGHLGERNDVSCASIERKIGIHASPTAVMLYGEGYSGSSQTDGAVGWMVGEEGRGLEYMFIMMNRARYDVGMQGLAISEAAYQQALSWATERVQGTPIGRETGVTILGHQDVRRMLLTMRSRIEAMRAVAAVAAAESDLAKSVANADERQKHAARFALLTPIIKGWLTELALDITSTGVQIHGGMGFVEDTGAGQYYRDARILPIYEGTTGIQANDFVFRKFLRDDGAAAQCLFSEIEADISAVRSTGQFQDLCDQVSTALQTVQSVAENLKGFGRQEPQRVAACAHAFLFMAGYLCGGWQMLRSANLAQQGLSGTRPTLHSQKFLQNKIETCGFFIRSYMPEVSMRAEWIKETASHIVGIDDSYFAAA